MKIAIVGCPFQTTYGHYISSLRTGLQNVTGSSVQWIATNCGCGAPEELARQFQVNDCDYFEMRTRIGNLGFIGYTPGMLKQGIKLPIRYVSNHWRAARYAELASGADVMHFQQTLNSYGADVVYHLLKRQMKPALVITLHELDPEQIAIPSHNRYYNRADAIIVHDRLIKEKLASLGVSADLINVVRAGTNLAEGEEAARDGIVFYGGHHLKKSKGIDILLQAYGILKGRLQKLPRLRIHGHYGTTPPDIREMARQIGVDGDIDWLDDLPGGGSPAEMVRLYRRSQVCVLPYRGSYAGLPVGVAASNRLPIIGTKNGGIPDLIGDLAIYVDENDAGELANRIEQILGDEAMQRDHGARLRAYAETHLCWDAVASDTLKVYQSAIERAARGRKAKQMATA